MKLRNYQETAIKESMDAWRVHKNILLSMATGTGKTATATAIADLVIRKTDKRVLFIAHREELISQSVGAFERFGIPAAVEMADDTIRNRLLKFSAVVASVQTLKNDKRLELYHPPDYPLVIIDECHHATASSYLKVLDHFKTSKVLGLTATPYRTDKVGLKNVFDTVAFQYTIQDGITDGYLCPVESRQVTVEGLSLESVKVKQGEFNDDELNELLMMEANLQAMVVPTVELAENRPTIVFCTKVAHAKAVAECFDRVTGRDGIAQVVHGKLERSERVRHLKNFEAGKIQFMVNVGVLTEGYDHPPTACIALFRPMKSLGLLAQMVGRGTRLCESKKDCLVLDFVGAHNTVQTVNVLDVLDGTQLDPETKKKAQELADDGEDAVEALQKAKSYVAELRKVSARMNINYSKTAVGLLDLFALPSAKGLYGGQLATPAQIEQVRKFDKKIDTKGLEKGEAARLIQAYFDRIKAKKCSVGQARLLVSRGYYDAWDWTFEEAKKKINEISLMEKWNDN